MKRVSNSVAATMPVIQSIGKNFNQKRSGMSISTICKTLVAVVVMCAVNVFAQTWDIGAESNPGGAASVKATLNNGTLTISGTGAMMVFPRPEVRPWHNNLNDITHVIIEDGVTTVSNMAFQYCHNLTSVTLGNSMTTIGWSAFSYCANLTRISLPDNITTIGDQAFMRTGLTSISIPNKVTTIGVEAFTNCHSLSTVVIGSGVTSIEGNAFRNCSTLIYILSFNPIPPTLGNTVFNGAHNDVCFYIPNNHVATYRADAMWGNLSCIKALSRVSFNSQGGSAVSPQINVGEGHTIEKPANPTRQGYTFLGWYKDAAGTDAWDFDVDVVAGSDITLYAKWFGAVTNITGVPAIAVVGVSLTRTVYDSCFYHNSTRC